MSTHCNLLHLMLQTQPTQLVPSALSADYHQQLNSTCLGWQAQEAVSGVRPQRAQARGRALLNLRLRDTEGGLLGRTLLTFILNKVLDPKAKPIACVLAQCHLLSVLLA